MFYCLNDFRADCCITGLWYTSTSGQHRFLRTSDQLVDWLQRVPSEHRHLLRLSVMDHLAARHGEGREHGCADDLRTRVEAEGFGPFQLVKQGGIAKYRLSFSA